MAGIPVSCASDHFENNTLYSYRRIKEVRTLLRIYRVAGRVILALLEVFLKDRDCIPR
jgi:hypothetical protein